MFGFFVLNLPDMMKIFYRLFRLLIGLYIPILAGVQPITRPVVESPLPGEALQGVVIITGSTDVIGFLSAEVAFSYESDDSNTWFLIEYSDTAIHEGTLAMWDTTTIADGTYLLRVLVHRKVGRSVERVIPGLRVRNYSPVETNTPEVAKDPEETTSALQVSPTSEKLPTPTNLPPNPAEFTPDRLKTSLIQGVLFSFIGFVFLCIYLVYRNFNIRK